MTDHGFPALSSHGPDAYTAAWARAQRASHTPQMQQDVLAQMKNFLMREKVTDALSLF